MIFSPNVIFINYKEAYLKYREASTTSLPFIHHPQHHHTKFDHIKEESINPIPHNMTWVPLGG